MFSSFLIVAWRNIRAQKTVSFINLFGMSIAIGVCVTVFLFLKNYWMLDVFHTNGERIFMVEYQTNLNNMPETWGDAPVPLAAALANDFPQVEHAVRVVKEGVDVFHKDELIGEVLTYTDAGFFDVFTFPLIYGSPKVLLDPNVLIISDEMAKKYFPTENPIGKPLTMLNGSRERVTFMVQGVAQPFPKNASITFDLLAGCRPTHTALKNQGWKERSNGIFVQLRHASDAEQLAAQLQPFVAPFNTANPDNPTTGFVLDNLRHPNAGAYNVAQRPAEAAHPAVTIIYALIAVLMLALSCFNYVNIALGAVAHRLREIGVRKAIGGSRKQIIFQFLTENLLLCFFSLLMGLFLAESLFVPLQNQVMTIKTDSLFQDFMRITPFLMALLVFVALVSGAYPALYVSRFNATVIFSGKQKFGGKSPLRRVMLGAQFTLAYLAVMVSIVLFVMAGDFKKMPWGYDASCTLVVSLRDSTQYSILKNEILQNSHIELVSGASQHIGYSPMRQIATIAGQTHDIRCYEVGGGYDRAMGLPLLSGRFFQSGGGDENAMVVSAHFARQLNWEAPLGKTVRMQACDYVVVGVMEDVKTVPSNVPRPIVYVKGKPSNYTVLVARFAPGMGKAVREKTAQDFKRLFAGQPIYQIYQSEVFDAFDRSANNLAKSFSGIALLALLLACMGLYGLALQHYAARLKEVCVRKLLGASVGQIALLVNRHFVVLLLIGGVTASLLCWVAVTLLLNQVSEYVGAYRPGVLPFLLANLLVLLTAIGTIMRQTWQMTRVKLAETLKHE